MLSTRYFCRWMVPTIAGLLCGYLIGAFLFPASLPKCSSRQRPFPTKAQPKVEIYRFLYDYILLIMEFRWDTTENLIRQKSYDKKFVYVAMMSAERYLDSRAHAAIDTWAREVSHLRKFNDTVKVEIFATGSNEINGVNVRQLPGVPDNVYPPQRKSFSMLRYLHDHYINEYDWFVRLDDDAYLSWPILEKLLRRLDPSLPLYIGKLNFCL